MSGSWTYMVLVLAALWGIIALRLAQPIILLQIAANVAGFVFVVATLHLRHQHALPAASDPPLTRPVRSARGDVAVLRVLRGAFDQKPGWLTTEG